MSKNTKMIIGSVVAVIFLATGYLFPVSMAEIVLPAERIFTVFGFNVTNTIIAAWVTMTVLTVLSFLATRKMEQVPRGLQNFMETLMELLLGLVEGVAGKKNGRRFFPLIASIFLFVIVSNWMGLLPGYGTIGIAEYVGHGHVLQEVNVAGIKVALLMPRAEVVKGEHGSEDSHASAVEDSHASAGASAEGGSGQYQAKAETDSRLVGLVVPAFRSANSDLNMTLALAIVAVLMCQYFGFTTLGVGGYGGKFINFKEGPIGFFVGILEIISEFSKLISFSFRLFGNIFAGEVLLAVIVFLVPWLGSLPFMGLELFVGFVQALVFSMLTLVFASLAVTPHHGGHDESEHAEHKAGHAGH